MFGRFFLYTVLFVQQTKIAVGKNEDYPRVSIGSLVNVTSEKSEGTIEFIGPASFGTFKSKLMGKFKSKEGAIIWYGIKLNKKNGNNNGTVNGRKYFECKEKHGIFVKQNEFDIVKANSHTKQV